MVLPRRRQTGSPFSDRASVVGVAQGSSALGKTHGDKTNPLTRTSTVPRLTRSHGPRPPSRPRRGGPTCATEVALPTCADVTDTRNAVRLATRHPKSPGGESP